MLAAGRGMQNVQILAYSSGSARKSWIKGNEKWSSGWQVFSAVAVLKLLGARCCARGLLLFLEGGDCILVTPESLSVHSSVY